MIQFNKNYTIPLKRYLKVSSGEMISFEEETEEGFPIIGGNGVRAYTTKFNTEAPSLVIGRVGAQCGNVHLIDTPFWASEHAFVVYPRKEFDLKFGEYMISSLNLNAKAIKTAQPLLNTTLVEETIGYFPPLEVQKAIAKYLDNETNGIDYLINQKQEQLQLLAEKRQALITHAVTKGINQNVRLKNSGINWLGEIPEHWEVERTKWLFTERNKRSETGEEELLTVSHITGVTPRSEKDVNMFEAETTEGYKIVCKNDLVINTLWAWMGAMGIAPVDGIVSPAYHVYQPLDRILPSYIDAIVRMPIFAKEVTKYSKGVWSSRLRLYPDGFYEVYLPVPSLEEQVNILELIQTEQTKIEEMSKVTLRSIELLKERRTSLITAAVTGQLEIPA